MRSASSHRGGGRGGGGGMGGGGSLTETQGLGEGVAVPIQRFMVRNPKP